MRFVFGKRGVEFAQEPYPVKAIQAYVCPFSLFDLHTPFRRIIASQQISHLPRVCELFENYAVH